MKQPALAFVTLTLLVGCATVPGDRDRTSSASYVGDRAAVPIDEIVVAVIVPGNGPSANFLNIHVALAAVINSNKLSFSSLGDVRSIISRQSPRISSAVVALVQQTPAPTENLAALRDEIVKETNRVFTNEFSRWTYAEDYDVQIVITSLYLTNGSVARNSPPRWFGW